MWNLIKLTPSWEKFSESKSDVCVAEGDEES